MKQFTLGFPSENVDKNNTFKSKFMKAIAEKFPFAKWHNNENDKLHSVDYIGPKDRLIFTLDEKPYISAFNRRFWNPQNLNDIKELFYPRPYKVKHYDYVDINEAMYTLRKYADEYYDYLRDRGYDYMLNGQPVRVYQNFVQIGNTIIPFNLDNYNFLLSPKYKETTNIIINLYKDCNFFEAA